MNADHRTPTSWLWDELVRRFGVEATLDLRAAFKDRTRQYHRDRRMDAVQTAPALHRQRVPWTPQCDEERDDD